MVIKNISYSVVNQILLILIMLASAAVLGRLIEPSIFGIFAILLAIHTLLFSIVDFGLTPVFIKLNKVTSEVKNVFFTLNILLGTCYAVLFLIIVLFIDQENIIIYSMVFTISVIITSINQQPIANLLRQHHQKKMMIFNFVSTLIALCIAIVLAYYDFGIYALLAQQLFSQIAMYSLLKRNDNYEYNIVGLNIVKRYKSDIVFSLRILASRIVNGVSLSYDKFFIGKFFGMELLGLYSKAFQFSGVPSANLGTAVSTPILSFIARKSEEEAKKLYPIIGNFIFFIAGNLAIFLIIYGDWFIVFLMGENWIEAGPYLQILAIWGVGKVLHGTLIVIYTNEKKMGEFSIHSIVALILNAVIFLIAYFFSKDITTTILYFSISNMLIWIFLYLITLYKYSLKWESLKDTLYFHLLNSTVFYFILSISKDEYFSNSEYKWIVAILIYLLALGASFILIFIFNKRLLIDIQTLRSENGQKNT
jgi:O-antigen/teichoic acid export membrane protein